MLRCKLKSALLLGFFLLFFPLNTAFSEPTRVSLNEPSKDFSEIQILQGSTVNLSNDFNFVLHNLMIVKVSSGTKIMTVDQFQAGQSFNLEFPQKGAYLICYSRDSIDGIHKDACLRINVGALRKA